MIIQIKLIWFSFSIRILKIDTTKLINENQEEKLTKKLVNLRENLINKSKKSENNEPQKLLVELASLSTKMFKIEIKSKQLNSLVLPLSKRNLLENKNKLTRFNKRNETEKVETDLSLMEIDSQTTNDTKPISRVNDFENDYICLKCSIVNKELLLVPPIQIFVPYNYPKSNPLVHCIQLEDFDDDMLPEYSKLLQNPFYMYVFDN